MGSTESAKAAPPAGAPAALGTEKALVRLGDITCTQSVVITPLGRHSVAGVRWTVEDRAQASAPRWLSGRLTGRRPPRHAPGVSGELHVIVEGEAWQHRCVIPVTSLAQVTDIYMQVLLARSMTTSATQREAPDPGRGSTPAPAAQEG